MASSYPNNTHNHEDYNPLEEDEDWLELGLGLSVVRPKPEFRSNSVGSTSASGFATHSNLGLGLGLGFDNEGVRSSSCGNHHGLWQHHHLSSLPSPPSPSSWAWPMDLGGFLHRQNLLLPVFNTHDYCQRPETGLWFSLRSLHSREGEALPQISKAYIRVKDEDVTVFMVKKYLVGKLGVISETEIDISCMGQKLLHSHTLKYVRDFIWLPRLFDSLNAIASTGSSHENSTNHLMPLHYGRRCFWD